MRICKLKQNSRRLSSQRYVTGGSRIPVFNIKPVNVLYDDNTCRQKEAEEINITVNEIDKRGRDTKSSHDIMKARERRREKERVRRTDRET